MHELRYIEREGHASRIMTLPMTFVAARLLVGYLRLSPMAIAA